MYKWYNNNVYKLIVFNNTVLGLNLSFHFLIKNVFFLIFLWKMIFHENFSKMLE